MNINLDVLCGQLNHLTWQCTVLDVNMSAQLWTLYIVYRQIEGIGVVTWSVQHHTVSGNIFSPGSSYQICIITIYLLQTCNLQVVLRAGRKKNIETIHIQTLILVRIVIEVVIRTRHVNVTRSLNQLCIILTSEYIADIRIVHLRHIFTLIVLLQCRYSKDNSRETRL